MHRRSPPEATRAREAKVYQTERNRVKKKKAEPPTDFEVEDAGEAFRKFENATRLILSVPKKKIDAMLAREKASRNRRKH